MVDQTNLIGGSAGAITAWRMGFYKQDAPPEPGFFQGNFHLNQCLLKIVLLLYSGGASCL